MLVKVKWKDGTRSVAYGENPFELFWTIDQVGDPTDCEIGLVQNSFIYSAKVTKNSGVSLREEDTDHTALAEELQSNGSNDYLFSLMQFVKEGTCYICLVKQGERDRITKLLESGSASDFAKIARKKNTSAFEIKKPTLA